jgi:hypothetical protein
MLPTSQPLISEGIKGTLELKALASFPSPASRGSTATRFVLSNLRRQLTAKGDFRVRLRFGLSAPASGPIQASSRPHGPLWSGQRSSFGPLRGLLLSTSPAPPWFATYRSSAAQRAGGVPDAPPTAAPGSGQRRR